MRGLKHRRSKSSQIFRRRGRAIRPAYEGIETCDLNFICHVSLPSSRAIRPAYEGIETAFVIPGSPAPLAGRRAIRPAYEGIETCKSASGRSP